jgi:hypothetical protein
MGGETVEAEALNVDRIYWHWKVAKWGGRRPVVWQGSGAGWVGDVVCDGNLLFVPFDELTRR